MSGRDVGASVRQRLLNQSRAQGRPFQELLQYFAMERFLYRLAQSPFADRFILKGALLLTAWRAPVSRPTIDIDLAGRTSNELNHITELVGTVCDVVAEPDGIEFNRASIEVTRIKRDADCEGVRVKFHAVLAKARIPMQIDIGFGDVVVPGGAAWIRTGANPLRDLLSFLWLAVNKRRDRWCPCESESLRLTVPISATDPARGLKITCSRS